MADVYLTAQQLREMSEFPYVKGKTDEALSTYVQRAHVRAKDFGPFPVAAEVAGDENYADMPAEMTLAIFLLAERMVLAAPATPMEAAGITQQSTGGLNASRASGGGQVGEVKRGVDVPPEALAIFNRWGPSGAPGLYSPIRTDVFGQTGVHVTGDPDHKVYADQDSDNLAPSVPSEVWAQQA